MSAPRTLAEVTIVERRGDDALDRQVDKVIDHAPLAENLPPAIDADGDLSIGMDGDDGGWDGAGAAPE